MSKRPIPSRLLRGSLLIVSVVLLAFLVFSTVPAGAQSEKPASSMQKGMQGKKMGMMDESAAPDSTDCRHLQQMMQKMHDQQARMQKDLDSLVQKMQAASGDAQQKVMVELLTTLVSQRGEMQQMREQMQPRMMQHLMQHARSGGGQSCPLMQGMGGMQGMGESMKHH